ncbi:hypothetical protein DVB73_02485 [Pseudomonas plecoglossicida]|uniref:Uncharacterized protein n=1 Tax=Pseudomonas plecoglossicida TaxID=70775 RepID=A0AAD0QUW9_PSEDL|nr:hypothetical protein DVB73_02485 [Pseudomonas plecoglossicida]EPB96456.1 hypothetical protein L321_08540 [Pseudomonas plecoglossicida NB2011]
MLRDSAARKGWVISHRITLGFEPGNTCESRLANSRAARLQDDVDGVPEAILPLHQLIADTQTFSDDGRTVTYRTLQENQLPCLWRHKIRIDQCKRRWGG